MKSLFDRDSWLYRYLEKKATENVLHIPRTFEQISPKELITGDILNLYYHNSATEFHGRFRDAEFGRSDDPPYHTTIFFEHSPRQQYLLDTELLTTPSLLKEYTAKEKVRIDVIRYPISEVQREALYGFMESVAIKEPMYDVGGYGSFIDDFKWLRWVPWIKPSDKKPFCSENVTIGYHNVINYKISERQPVNTAPVDIQRFAILSKIPKLFTLQPGVSYQERQVSPGH
jgi:hypothetical protein